MSSTLATSALSGADDPQVFAHAQQDARTLATRDVDFADTIAYPIGNHHGIVVARIPSKRPLAAVGDAFVRALNGLEPNDVHGCLFTRCSSMMKRARRVDARERPAEAPTGAFLHGTGAAHSA
jgi:hypothetical protein